MFETAIVTVPVNFSAYMDRLRMRDPKGLIMRRMRQVGSGYALQLINDFKESTRTWSFDVAFRHDVRITADGLDITVYTDDEIYGFVNNGTSVRYATMSDDFVPKTEPGWIGSGPGAGRMLFVNKKVPRPGIEARHFDELIAEENSEWIQDRMERAMREAIDEAMGGW